jgi:peptidoglycan/LPS O-acetylase OafA/YrhL
MQTTHPNLSISYRRDIDGLRAVAVLFVVAYHAFPSVLPGGFIGVDVFFVISGFLISQVLFNSIENKTFSFAAFYKRRINRLFPALILVLVFALVIGLYYFTPDELARLGKHTFSGAIFFSNLVSLSEFGYFDTASELKPLLHLWSLAIEEQFYLLWPIALFLAWKLRIGFASLIIVVLGLSFSLNLYRSSYDPSFAFFSLQTRAWELLVGALVGYCAHKNLVISKAAGQTLGWLGVSGLVLGVLLIDRHRAYPSGWALLPVCGTVFLLLAGQSGWINRRVLSTKTLVSIGLISYPLYLWHWILLSMTAVVAGHMSAMHRSLLVLCSFALATITYWLIEKPVRQKLNTGKTALILLAFMAAIALSGLFIYKSHGALGQFSVPPLVMESGQQDCMSALKAKEFCVFGNVNAAHSILVYGDSHAEHLTAALGATFGNTHKIIFSYASSCFFGYGESFHHNAPGCQPFIDLIGTLKGTKLDAVIRSQLWHGYSALADDAAFDRALRDAAKAFDLGPTKVIIVGSVPNADLACEKKNYYFSQRDGQRQCSAMLESRAQSERFITRTSALSLAPNVYFVYPQQKLCDQNACKVIENGVSYYTDVNHLSKAGAMLVMPEIASILKK